MKRAVRAFLATAREGLGGDGTNGALEHYRREWDDERITFRATEDEVTAIADYLKSTMPPKPPTIAGPAAETLLSPPPKKPKPKPKKP